MTHNLVVIIYCMLASSAMRPGKTKMTTILGKKSVTGKVQEVLIEGHKVGKDSAALLSAVSTLKLELLWVERGKCEGANILINCIRVECKNGMRVEEMGKQSINLSGYDAEELRSVIHNYNMQ